MIKHMIGRGIGFAPNGVKYLITAGLAIGAASLTAVFMTPLRGVWGPL